MKTFRRSLFGGLLITLLTLPVLAAAVEVPTATDLTRTAALSGQKNLPILLMFSAPGCPYCRRLEEEYLKPMIKSGDYDDKVIIRKVQISAGARVVDFSGKETAVDDLAARYKVFVTPTVVFLGPRGHQLAKKLVGFTSPDFYGSYLDAAIDTSLNRLGSTAVSANTGR